MHPGQRSCIMCTSMGFQRSSSCIFKHVRRSLSGANAAVAPVEFLDSPIYPEIYDATKEGLRRRERQQWYDSIRVMPTVEQKMHEIGLKYGRQKKVYCIQPDYRRYHLLPFFKYSTRTDLLHQLPQFYDSIDVDDLCTDLKPLFLETIAMQMCHVDRHQLFKNNEVYREDVVAMGVLRHLISALTTALIPQYKHLSMTQVDYLPRCDAYWWHSQFYPNAAKRLKDKEFVDIAFQYLGHRGIHIRMPEPLKAFIPRNDNLCTSSNVEPYPYHPTALGIRYEMRYGTTVPGFWPGDPAEHAFLQLYSRAFLTWHLAKVGSHDWQECLDGYAIMASFAWLMGLATYQGFTPFHEITYPLTTQTIITNGQDWSFYAYQLNTICFHKDVDTHSHQNICWKSRNMRLFEKFEDGNLKGVDDEVLKTLLKFFINTPTLPTDIELKPYLGEDVRSEEERTEMQKQLRNMLCNRPDHHRFKKQIPLYKWIYKFHPEAPPALRMK